jgi:hypothetical protein
MESYKSKIIKEIAHELDCGFDCYYNPKTDEIMAIPNFRQISDEDEFRDAFGREQQKIAKSKTDFIKIEVLESFESFKIMERFTSQIADKHLQAELENILVRKKPFQNFKNRIDNSDSRQNWFDFKRSELERIVKNHLDKGKACKN